MVIVLTSLNFRKGIQPNTTVIWHSDNPIPSGWTFETSLACNFAKGAATAGANPNASVGTASHCDPSACLPAHGHTAGCISPHGHPGNTGSAPATPGSVGPTPGTAASHTHPVSVTGTAAPGSIGPVAVTCHSHGSACNNPPFIETKHITKDSTSLGIRNNKIPLTSTILWACNVACIPNGYAVESNLIGNRFIKSVTNACTCVGTTGGSACHSHAAGGGHTHPASITGHTHTTTINSSGSSCQKGGGPTLLSDGAHTHPGTTSSSNSGCGTVPSACSDHSHGSSSALPQYVDIAFIQKQSQSFRIKSIPTKGIVEWVAANTACKPPCLVVADGTGDTTVNLLSRYPRSTLNACTNPGSTGGCATHTHSDAPSHGHPVGGQVPHSHTSPSTGGNSPPNGGTSPGPRSIAAAPHTHPVSINSGTAVVPAASACSPHTHTSCSVPVDPLSKTVQYLQRV